MEIVRQHFDTIDSTNTWAKLNAHKLDPKKITIVTADTQTAGRGRFNRRWVSPEGHNIYTTFVFFVEKERRDIGNIPQLLALSVAQSLLQLDLKALLKWPNDIMLSDKKVAGILCETTPISNQICVILGIGLNVNMPEEVLKTIDRPATSLKCECHHDLDVPMVAKLLESQFLKDLTRFLKEGFDPFLPHYKELMWIPAKGNLRFHDNLVVWEGTFHSINNDGSLNVKLGDGTIKTFVAGELI